MWSGEFANEQEKSKVPRRTETYCNVLVFIHDNLVRIKLHQGIIGAKSIMHFVKLCKDLVPHAEVP